MFSIIIFTLNGLYELHEKARNWWTTSNCNLPLIRYRGCTIKFYASSSVDYISVPIRCGDLKATEQTFQSCQPSVLALNKRKVVMLCKNYKHGRKPYRKIFIRPPALLYNKWYFQKEFANYPLLMLLSSAASFDRYYCPASSISETVGFESLNTTFFQLHGFKTPGTTPYTPNENFALFGIDGRTTFEHAKIYQLVLLGNTLDMTRGNPLGTPSTTKSTWENTLNNYFSKKTNMGNPFLPYWFGSDIDDGLLAILPIKNKTVLEVLKTIDPQSDVKDHLQKPSKPFTVSCRYNPQADMGHNGIFITRIANDPTPWHKPSDDALIQQGLPLWLLYWGWHDYIVKAHTVQNLDTDYINVITSDYITHSPKQNNMTYYVPLDWFFLQGRSPYGQKDDVKAYDRQNWHPKANFQTQSIAHLLQSGPATAKLPPLISCEGHITYKFHFKVGGCPPSMDEVCNPQTQPTYPQPGNLISSILLQNPEYPIQYYINSFDQRREMLTERAAKRLKTDTEFKESLLKPAGKTLLEVQTTKTQETSDSSSEEEESEETLQQQLRHQYNRQRKLQQRILKLLTELQHST